MRYIELNPIRANIVSHPGDYQWSSYHANAQNGVDPLIDNHPLYTALGATDESRQSAYRELFRHHIENETLHDIRGSLNHELVLGRSYFKEKIENMIDRQTRLGQPGRPRIEEDEAIYYVGY